jgi:hypothetical protein
MYVSERPFQFSDLAKAVQRSAGLGQTCPDGTLDCLVDPAVAASEAAEQAINTAQLTSGNSSYYTTVGGVSISNSVLVIGGLLIAGLVFFGAAKK